MDMPCNHDDKLFDSLLCAVVVAGKQKTSKNLITRRLLSLTVQTRHLAATDEGARPYKCLREANSILPSHPPTARFLG
jgi:hypothetical protein